MRDLLQLFFIVDGHIYYLWSVDILSLFCRRELWLSLLFIAQYSILSITKLVFFPPYWLTITQLPPFSWEIQRVKKLISWSLEIFSDYYTRVKAANKTNGCSCFQVYRTSPVGHIAVQEEIFRTAEAANGNSLKSMRKVAKKFATAQPVSVTVILGRKLWIEYEVPWILF